MERIDVRSRLVWAAVFVLIAVVLVFAAVRVAVDTAHIAAGTILDPSLFEHRYVRHPWLAYAHIAPGVLYLVLAPLQLWSGLRNRHLRWHRRWMIRAFAVGLAVGTIRLWVGLFQAFGILSFRDSFGPAFWLAFLMHAAAAELWLRWRPSSVPVGAAAHLHPGNPGFTRLPKRGEVGVFGVTPKSRAPSRPPGAAG